MAEGVDAGVEEEEEEGEVKESGAAPLGPRRRHAAQVQEEAQEGQRQRISSSADMVEMHWLYDRRRHASPDTGARRGRGGDGHRVGEREMEWAKERGRGE